MIGGDKGRLIFFQKIIRFGSGTPPLYESVSAGQEFWLFYVLFLKVEPPSHRSGAGIKYQQKMTTMETWTFYSRQLFLFARLSYYFITVLRLTKSSTLLSAPVLASTRQVSIVVIENVTDIFFPKWALLERCDNEVDKMLVWCIWRRRSY